MALVKCKECGSEVSTSAKACPKCGAKPPKKTSRVTWVFLGLLVFVVGLGALNGPSGSGSATTSAGTTPIADARSEKDKAVSALQIKKFDWQKGGFDSVMKITITVQNTGNRDVKDIRLECTHASNSGTVIDSNKATIYELFPAGKSKTVRDFNMGFINNQVASSSCAIVDGTVM